MCDTLIPFNLSHVDFPDGPAAIQWSRLMFSCTTQDASPNEHIYPEIWTNNHQFFTYSFGWSWPAIFPDTDILGALPLVEGGGAKHSPPGPYDAVTNRRATKMMINDIFKNRRRSPRSIKNHPRAFLMTLDITWMLLSHFCEHHFFTIFHDFDENGPVFQRSRLS